MSSSKHKSMQDVFSKTLVLFVKLCADVYCYTCVAVAVEYGRAAMAFLSVPRSKCFQNG